MTLQRRTAFLLHFLRRGSAACYFTLLHSFAIGQRLRLCRQVANLTPLDTVSQFSSAHRLGFDVSQSLPPLQASKEKKCLLFQTDNQILLLVFFLCSSLALTSPWSRIPSIPAFLFFCLRRSSNAVIRAGRTPLFLPAREPDAAPHYFLLRSANRRRKSPSKTAQPCAARTGSSRSLVFLRYR